MTPNEGSLDRILRLVLGAVLLALSFAVQGIVAWILVVISLVLVVTAVVGWCPAYAIFGIKTCSAGRSSGEKTA